MSVWWQFRTVLGPVAASNSERQYGANSPLARGWNSISEHTFSITHFEQKLRQISWCIYQFCWSQRLYGRTGTSLPLVEIQAPSKAAEVLPTLWQVGEHSILHTYTMCIKSPALGMECGVSPKFNCRTPSGLWTHCLLQARLDQYPVQSFTGQDSGYCKLLTKEQ